MIVLNREHEEFYKHLNLSDPALVIQPGNRGTASAILYALLRLVKIGHRGSVVIFPSDHYISDDPRFMTYRSSLESDAALSRENRPAGSSRTAAGKPIRMDRTGAGSGLRSGGDRAHYTCARLLGETTSRLGFEAVAARLSLEYFRNCCRHQHPFGPTRKGLPRTLCIFGPLVSIIATPQEQHAIEHAYRRIDTHDFSAAIQSETGARLDVLPVNGVEWDDLGEPSRVLATLSRLDTHPRWVSTFESSPSFVETNYITQSK
jgi:hypothetical protein